MRFSTALITASACCAFACVAQADDYLTKEGQLRKPLTVVQKQGGFAGFTGVQYRIAPDGSWESQTLFNEKLTPKGKGKLTGEQLARLGALLDKYQLARLPKTTGKPPGANPHILMLEFDKQAVLLGQTPPKLDPDNPTGSVDSRFAGIWQGVVGLLEPQKKDK